MPHGIQSFFSERARCRRRVAALSVALSVLMLSGVWVLQLAEVARALRRVPLLRFGFEGPTRYVQLVQVEAQPGRADDPLTDVGRVEPIPARGGGAGGPVARRSTHPVQKSQLPLPDPGDPGEDLIARALASRGRVPIFQSTELVIEHLVRPIYPEEARERGIEGKVAVLARVDTAGQVIETEVMTASGERQLDRAAEMAVLQCRFRPYRIEGEAREVYAVFHFSFRIY